MQGIPETALLIEAVLLPFMLALSNHSAARTSTVRLTGPYLIS